MKPQYEPKTLPANGESYVASAEDIARCLSANPQLRAAVLVRLPEWEELAPEQVERDRLRESLRAAESALAAERIKHQDTYYQLGKAQGEAEGHALARKGLEAELATERARAVAAEAMVEELTRDLEQMCRDHGLNNYADHLARRLASSPDEQTGEVPPIDCGTLFLRERNYHHEDCQVCSALAGMPCHDHYGERGPHKYRPVEQAKDSACVDCHMTVQHKFQCSRRGEPLPAAGGGDSPAEPKERERDSVRPDCATEHAWQPIADLKRQLEEAKLDFANACDVVRRLEARLEAAQAELQAIRGELNEWGFWKPSGDIMSVKQLINAYCDLDAKLEAAQASAVDPGELAHLREAAELLRDGCADGDLKFRLRLEQWAARDQKRAAPVAEERCSCGARPNGASPCEPVAAQPSPAQEPVPLPHLTKSEVSRAIRGMLTRADVAAIVDSRVAELARAAVTRANVDHHAARLALQRLAEAAEAGKASGGASEQ